MYIKLHGAVTSHSMNNTESGVSRNLVEASVNQCRSTPLQVPAGLRLPPMASSHRLLPEPEMKMEMKTKEGMKPMLSFPSSLSSPALSLSCFWPTSFTRLWGCLSVCFIASCLKATISLFICFSVYLYVSLSRHLGLQPYGTVLPIYKQRLAIWSNQKTFHSHINTNKHPTTTTSPTITGQWTRTNIAL